MERVQIARADSKQAAVKRVGYKRKRYLSVCPALLLVSPYIAMPMCPGYPDDWLGSYMTAPHDDDAPGYLLDTIR